MASRQLGKLRQWAGEVISSKEKSSISEEFQDLERDIDLRKNGAQKLLLAAEAYHHALSKKSLCEALSDSDKLLPIDALGIVMIMHGDEFPEDSAFGTSLAKFGRAHCKVATLQEAYALTLRDTFITAVERYRDEIKEYEALRKKLEARKVALDSATLRHEKMRSSKKDKDRVEAEEEYERAQQRYDETAEDMRAHMHEIQDKEISQQKELTNFLNIEINYVQGYLEVLKEVRSEWPDRSSGTRPKSRSHSISLARPVARPVVDSSEDEIAGSGTRSMKHRKSPSLGAKSPSRPPSRPSSRLSRKRTNSSGRLGSDEVNTKPGEKGRRFSVSGWATNAVDSITPSAKSAKSTKVKDKDSFTTLDDEEDMPRRRGSQDSDRGSMGSSSLQKSGSFGLGRRLSRKKKSKDSLSAPSPKVPPKILKPPSLQESKHVTALYDFKGGPDELTFKAGQDIRVINEVVEGWWMGETNGRKGLFPTSHVSFSPQRPSLHLPASGTLSPLPSADFRNEGYVTSDMEEEMGYHKPLAHSRSPINPTFGNGPADVTDQEDNSPYSSHFAPQSRPRRFSDDFAFDQPNNIAEKEKRTPRVRAMLLPGDLGNGDGDDDPASQPLISRAMSEQGPGAQHAQESLTKRAPPPPPPRRFLSHHPGGSTPAVPQRKLGPSVPSRSPPKHPGVPFSAAKDRHAPSSNGSTASGGPHMNGSSTSAIGYDVSPFESAADLSTFGCIQFKQNPFHPTGMCGNCRQYHV